LIKLYDDGSSVKKVACKIEGPPYEVIHELDEEIKVDKIDMLYRQYKESRVA